MANELFKKIADGAIWMLLFKVADRGLGLISTLILVRLLTPTDFGIVAMAVAMVAIVELLTSFGFDTAIIRQKDATDEHYHTAWTFDVLFGIFVAVVMVSFAGQVARFYNEPEVELVLYVLALSPLLSGFENVGIVAFRKDLQFRNEFKFQVWKKIAGFVVTVPLAFLLRNYWALVIGVVFSRFAALCLSFLMHPFRPKFSLSEAKSLMSFSVWLLAGNLTNYVKERSSALIIGRLESARSLGLYQVSYEFANMPTTEFGAPINRALMPGFAKFQDDQSGLQALYASSMSLVALVSIPAAVGIAATAPFLVPILLGDQWLSAGPLMQILAINGAMLLLQASIWSVLIGSDLPRPAFYANAIYAVLLLCLMVVLTQRYGLLGAAWSCLLTSVVTFPVYLLPLKRHLQLPPTLFLKALIRPILASLAMAAVVVAVLPGEPDPGTTLYNLRWLVAGVLCGVATYVTVVVMLWLAAGRPNSAELMLFNRARDELRARSG